MKPSRPIEEMPGYVNISWDQKSPCNDCPFKKSTGFKNGVQSNIGEILTDLVDGGFIAFSCHKTDPRSDDPKAQDYKGKMQHCAGFMMMAEKSQMRTIPMQAAIDQGKLKIEELKGFDEVYSVGGMCRDLLKHCKEKDNEENTTGGITTICPGAAGES